MLIDPKILREARIEALRSEKKLWEWLEEAIKERIEREYPPLAGGLFTKAVGAVDGVHQESQGALKERGFGSYDCWCPQRN